MESRLSMFQDQMEKLKTYLSTNKYWEGARENDKRTIRRQAKKHVVHDNIVYQVTSDRTRREVITSMERAKEVLRHNHSLPSGGHSGIGATLNKLSCKYYWPGIKEDVTNYVKACLPCQHYEKIKTQAPEMKPIVVNEPLELVAMDLIGPLPLTERGNRYILTMRDHFTKFVDLFPLPKKDAGSVCSAVKTFIYRWGAPKRFLSDQGREFVNEMNSTLCELLEIKHSVASAYHPQTNGLVERTNSTVKTRLSKLQQEHNKDWDNFLEEVAFSLRTQQQTATKFTPFFLMFGRHPRQPIEMKAAEEDVNVAAAPDEEAVAQYAGTIEDDARERNKIARSNQDKANKKAQEVFANRATKGVKTFRLQSGDLALKKNTRKIGRKGDTTEPDWLGPYRIVDIGTNQTVQLAANDEEGQLLARRVPYGDLKPVRSETPAAGESTKQGALLSQFTPFDFLSLSSSCVSSVCSDRQQQGKSNEHVQFVSGASEDSEDRPKTASQPSAVPTNKACRKRVQAVKSDKEIPAKRRHRQGSPKIEKSMVVSSSVVESDDDFVAIPHSMQSTTVTQQSAQQLNGNTENDDCFCTGVFGPQVRKGMPLPAEPAAFQHHGQADMKRILDSKTELSDLHIDHFSAMLKRQFKHVDGFQPVCVLQAENCFHVGTPQDKFVQIIFVGGHWVTVSNVDCAVAGEVKVYDSMFTYIRPQYKKTFLKQLGWLLFTRNPCMIVHLMDVQRQKGSVTCGLFALGFARALCEGTRPEHLHFREGDMWTHLASCLESDEFTPFPVSAASRRSRGIVRTYSVNVFCVCRQPNDKSMPMVQCHICLEWYHFSCEKVESVKEDEEYVCSVCQSLMKKV